MTGYNSFKYLSDYEAKKQIIAIGKRMYDKGFVASNDGNISCRVGPKHNLDHTYGGVKGIHDTGHARKDEL